jgi:hypothetical protein
MSTTYQASVTSYTGTITDTQHLSNVLTAGAQYLIDRIPENKLDKYASALTDAGSGIDVSTTRIARAHKNGYRARRVDPGLKTQITPSGALSIVSVVSGGSGYHLNDILTLSQGTSGTCKVTSINSTVVTSVETITAGSSFTQGVKTTTVSPSGGTNCTLFVVPSNGSIHEATNTDPVYYVENTMGYVIPSGGTIIGVTYPSVAYGDDPSSKPTGFPPELKQGIVLYAVIQILLAKSNTILNSLDALNLDNVTPPAQPSSASFTYTDAVLGNYQITGIGSFGEVPTFTKPVTNLTTTPNDLSLSSIVLPAPPPDFAITVTAPTSLSAASYSYTDAILGTYTSTTIDTLPTAPSYIQPVSSFDMTNSNTYLASGTVDIEKTNAEVNRQSAFLDKFGKDQYNELNRVNSELESYKSSVQKIINQAQLDQERLLQSASKTTDLNIQNKAKEIETAINQYSSNLQKHVQDINKYQIELNGEVQVAQQRLQNYSVQINAIRLLLDKATQEYRANLDKWTTERQTQLQLYTNEIQNQLNLFNSDVEGFRANIQREIAQAQLNQDRLLQSASKTTDLNLQNEAKELERQITEHSSNLQKYNALLGEYQSVINKVVSKYSNDIQKYFSEVQGNNQLIEECRKELQFIIGTL